MDSNKNKTGDLVIGGIFIAIVCVATMLLKVPSPTRGYVNIGDTMIMLIAIFFSRKKAAFAGGFGSALADILLCYSHWAVFSFLIKGTVGYIIGSISNFRFNKSKLISINTFVAILFGEVFMVIAYFFAGSFIKGSMKVALTSVPGNLSQGFISFLIFLVLGKALEKVRIQNFYEKLTKID